MSARSFFAGLLAGAIGYGTIRKGLWERENVVLYTVDQIKEKIHGETSKTSKYTAEKYAPIRTREHEYYTAVRKGWNSKVWGFRNGVLDLVCGSKQN